MKNSTAHLTFETLTDLAETRLASAETLAAQAHLTACESCTASWAQLSHVVGVMRDDFSEEPPAYVTAQLMALFRVQRPPQPTVWQKLQAVLSFDSLTHTPAYGLRQSGASTTRQLLYSAGEYDFDLRVTPETNGVLLSGQMLGPECANGTITLVSNTVRVQTPLNEWCEFTLPHVPSDTYTLLLEADGVSVEIAGLTL